MKFTPENITNTDAVAGEAQSRYNGPRPPLPVSTLSFGSEDQALQYLATILVDAYMNTKTS